MGTVLRALAIVLAATTAASARDTNGFEKYVADLAAAPAEAVKRLAGCDLLVTPGGAVRQPCKLELADLVGATTGKVVLAAKNVKRQSFPRSMLEWIEADVEARAAGKLVATFHVIEVGGQGNPDAPNDGWFVAAQAWSRPIADKDVLALAAAGSLHAPAISDAVSPLPKGTAEQDVNDREIVVSTMKQVLSQSGLGAALEAFAEGGAIVIGSAPHQRYTGKSGAKAVHAWKLALAQKGGIAVGGGSMVAFAATTVIGTTHDKGKAIDVPYVAFAVYIQRMTGGGSLAPFPALVQFAVPQ